MEPGSEVEARGSDALEVRPAAHIQEKAWLVWLAAYGVAGPDWVPQLGFLTAALDHIDSIWVKLLFLNIPLQLALMLLAHALKAGSERARRASVVVAASTSVLIVIHVVISLAVAIGAP